jgi:hypothetical protein
MIEREKILKKSTEISFGSTTSEICLKNPVGCLQQPRAAVIGLSLPSVAPRKWIFSHISLPVAPKPDFHLLCIIKNASPNKSQNWHPYAKKAHLTSP